MPQTAFFAWDCRGCGRSPGERGDALHLGQLEQDMDAFLGHLGLEFGVQAEETVVIAHSVAAVVAGLWALDYAPRLRGLVLATPALQVKLYVPFARQGLSLLNFLGMMPKVWSYVKGAALTHDPEQARSYDEDPLISREIATRVLLDLYKGAERLLNNADLLEVRTQVLVARADWVIKNNPIKRLYEKLRMPGKEIRVYKGLYHAIFHETGRALVFADVRRFVLDCFAGPPPDRQHLLRADKEGPSADQFQWLQSGVPPISLRNLLWSSTRLGMKTLGRASQGVKIGLSSGFSSGPMLDYVYQNKVRGFTPFGKMVDYFYLNSIGWLGIRQRRIHMVELLELALLLRKDGEIHLADIAGGPGRYLLDFLNRHPEERIRVTVRDQDELGLHRGRRLACEQQETRITYQSGDAFSLESLATLERVDIGIVSGLYELFWENSAVLQSLQGLAQAIPSGGYLLYTNQPSHPQLELIAETLTHGDGSRWVMRCRGSAEMDELVRHAGFKKVASRVDRYGIFSVSLARRI